MGCDIHFYAEKKVHDNWVPAVPIIDLNNGEYPDEGPDLDTPYNEKWYTDRNYDLFSILADVRNGFGFAGVKTGEGFVPIDQPRGVPHDASPGYRMVVEAFGEDGHSHSWLTIKDLLTYDWTQTTTKTACVDLKTYADWTACKFWGKACGEAPKEYCGAVSGPSVVHVTNGEMDRLAKSLRQAGSTEERAAILKEHVHTYTQVTWETPYYEAAGNFWKTVMPRLCKLGTEVRDWERVRIVFFFDN